MKPELFNSLKGYKAKFLLNDLMSGLLVAIIALPMSIALGIQSVPANISNGIQIGIITSIIGGFIISALGGTRFQIGGSTAAFFVIIYNYIANPEIGLLGFQFVTILAGIWLLIFTLIKADKLLKYMPFAVTIGFTTGVGITLMAGQFKDFLGLNASGGSNAIEKIILCVKNIETFNWAAFVVAIVGLAVLIILQRINKKIPGAFVTLIVCTALTLLLNTYADANIPTIGTKYGEIRARFNFVDFGSIRDVNFAKIILPSFVIAALCMMESLLSAKVADGMANTRHNSNQELFALGIANVLSPIFGGMPAIGAIARTTANIKSGAKSPLAGIFHSVFMCIMYFSLMGVIKYIPLAAFAAILIIVSINMANFPIFFKIVKFGYRDTAMVIVSCLLTIFFNLIYGIIGGLILTFLVNIPNFKNKLAVEQVDGEKTIVKVSGAIYFLSVNKLMDTLTKTLDLHNEIIIDFAKTQSIDESSIEKFTDFSKRARDNKKIIQFVNCNEKINKRITKYCSTLEK